MSYEDTARAMAAGAAANGENLAENMGVLGDSVTDTETPGTVGNNFATAGANLAAVGETVQNVPNYLQGSPDGQPVEGDQGGNTPSPEGFAAAFEEGGPEGAADYVASFAPAGGDYTPGEQSFEAIGQAFINGGDFVTGLPGVQANEEGAQYGLTYAAQTISEVAPAFTADVNRGLIEIAETIAFGSAAFQGFVAGGDEDPDAPPPGQEQDATFAGFINQGYDAFFDGAETAAVSLTGTVPEQFRDGYTAFSEATLGDGDDSLKNMGEAGRDALFGMLPEMEGGDDPTGIPAEEGPLAELDQETGDPAEKDGVLNQDDLAAAIMGGDMEVPDGALLPVNEVGNALADTEISGDSTMFEGSEEFGVIGGDFERGLYAESADGSLSGQTGFFGGEYPEVNGAQTPITTVVDTFNESPAGAVVFI